MFDTNLETFYENTDVETQYTDNADNWEDVSEELEKEELYYEFTRMGTSMCDAMLG